MAHCPICDTEVEVEGYLDGDLITCMDCNENLLVIKKGKKLELEAPAEKTEECAEMMEY